MSSSSSLALFRLCGVAPLFAADMLGRRGVLDIVSTNLEISCQYCSPHIELVCALFLICEYLYPRAGIH